MGSWWHWVGGTALGASGGTGSAGGRLGVMWGMGIPGETGTQETGSTGRTGGAGRTGDTGIIRDCSAKGLEATGSAGIGLAALGEEGAGSTRPWEHGDHRGSTGVARGGGSDPTTLPARRGADRPAGPDAPGAGRVSGPPGVSAGAAAAQRQRGPGECQWMDGYRDTTGTWGHHPGVRAASS